MFKYFLILFFTASLFVSKNTFAVQIIIEENEWPCKLNHLEDYKLSYFWSNNNIALNENEGIKLLLKYLSSSKDCIFAQMSGSGSCCFAVFEKQEYASKIHSNVKKNFPNLWSFVGENNTIND